jgi:hypothetical protein
VFLRIEEYPEASMVPILDLLINTSTVQKGAVTVGTRSRNRNKGRYGPPLHLRQRTSVVWGAQWHWNTSLPRGVARGLNALTHPGTLVLCALPRPCRLIRDRQTLHKGRELQIHTHMSEEYLDVKPQMPFVTIRLST